MYEVILKYTSAVEGDGAPDAGGGRARQTRVERGGRRPARLEPQIASEVRHVVHSLLRGRVVRVLETRRDRSILAIICYLYRI